MDEFFNLTGAGGEEKGGGAERGGVRGRRGRSFFLLL